MQNADVGEATHVKLPDGRVEKIISKWGVNPDGSLAKPSQGGFGVVTESNQRVEGFGALAYFKE